MELDELLYNALRADSDLMQSVGSRIESTCFEVSPDEQDNTQLPCIIVTDDGLTSTPDTKDNEWESTEDRVQASVEIDGRDPKEVKSLVRKARRVIAAYVCQLEAQGEDIPRLQSVQTNGISWDWMKPCYHETITYQCDVDNHLYD